MDKHTTKKNTYNAEILIALENKYGFKKNYIQKAIRGDRTGTIPLKIQEEYNKLVAAAKTAVNSKIEKL